MQYLSAIALRLGLRDLVDKRAADLTLSNAGKTYAPGLQAHLTYFDSVSAAYVDPTKPVTEQLDVADDEHDDIGAALWHQTESYLRYPFLEAQLVEAIKRIQHNFIPALAEIRDAYAIEAQRALDRKPLLAKYKADLELFPIAGGKTLYDWTSAYINAGERIHHLLSDRADATDKSRTELAQKRREVISLLNNFRNALLDERKHNPALPADIESRIFGYFDELEQMRAAAARAKKKPAPATESPKNEPSGAAD